MCLLTVFILYFGFLLFYSRGGVVCLFGLLVIISGLSGVLLHLGSVFLLYLILSSFIGTLLVFFLLLYTSFETTVDSTNRNSMSSVIFLSCFTSSFTSLKNGRACDDLILYEFWGFSSVLESSLILWFICFSFCGLTVLILRLTLCVYGIVASIHFCFMFGIVSLWFMNLGLLGVIGLLLCFLPSGYRWIMKVKNGVRSGRKWKEIGLRWLGDVYEVGVGTSGGSVKSFHSLSSGTIGGMSGVWEWSILFLWGDLIICLLIGAICCVSALSVWWFEFLVLIFLVCGVLMLSFGCRILSFGTMYFTTTGHKFIGILYGYSGYCGGLLGFYFSLWIRAELAFPGLSIVRKVKEVSIYNHWISVHGLLMLFVFVMPIALGFYGNYLLPLLIGACELSLPRMNGCSFWMFCGASFFFLLADLLMDKPVASGWLYWNDFNELLVLCLLPLFIGLYLVVINIWMLHESKAFIFSLIHRSRRLHG